MTARLAGAAIVAIGNELLSGKVADLNVPLLTRELRELGLPLLEVRWIPDDIETIGATVRELSARFEVVFSSGGVGPTHDDVTFAGVAHGFGLELARNEELAADIARLYGPERTNEAVLRMADVPEGATLLTEEALKIPVVVVRNVYILPGEPTIFRRKWKAIRERFRRAPFHLRKVYTSLDEGVIAGVLEETERRFGISVGSYPRYDTAEYAVLVTLESKDAARVDEALAFLLSKMPPEAIVRQE